MSGVIKAPSRFTTTCSAFQHFKAPTTQSNLTLHFLRFGGPKLHPTKALQCNRSTRPGALGSGDGDSRTVLDAFFLGKALAEALNERIESTIGEVFSTVGRLQAEQQKQLQDFQEEVLERAKRAKEKAAREAMEAQGIVPKSTTTNTMSSVTNVLASVPSPPINNAVSPANTSSSISDPTTVEADTDPASKDTVVDIPTEN